MQFAIFRISILPPFFLPSYLPMIIACHSSLLSLYSSEFPFCLLSSFLLPFPPIKARRRRLNPASTGGGGESRRAGVGEEKACRARLITRRSRPGRGAPQIRFVTTGAQNAHQHAAKGRRAARRCLRRGAAMRDTNSVMRTRTVCCS